MTDQYAKQVLVSTDWLNANLDSPTVRIVEVDEQPDLYGEGHVPGAVKLHWKNDLQDAVRRDVVDPRRFAELLGNAGIGNDTTVVLYGDRNNWFAAYAYWYLKLYRHVDVRIVDGGRDKWITEGRTLTTDVPAHTPVVYEVPNGIDESIRVFREEVRDVIGAGSASLVDVRSPAEYRGELLTADGYPDEGASRGGHIPTARNVPWATAVAADGTFKPRAELEQLYGAQGVTGDEPVIAYCRIGERSSHTWFVLRELLGHDDVRNYDGSWTEWGNLVAAPIATGEATREEEAKLLVGAR